MFDTETKTETEEVVEREGTQEKKFGFLLLAFLAGAIAGSSVGFFQGKSTARDHAQAEAVKAGHARHKVVDEFGKTAFEWMPAHAAETAPPVPGQK